MKTKEAPVLESVEAAERMARRILEHFFGKRPRQLVHQSAGLSNFVFVAHHAEGDFVVRISPDPTRLQVFLKEQWAMAMAREHGIPTPRVLEVGSELVPFPYMISERTRGEEAVHHPERLGTLREMGRLAACINEVHTNGFGSTFDWSQNELSRHGSWDEFLHQELELESRLHLLAKQHMLTAEQLKKVRSLLEGLTEVDARPVLNHGDLRLKNVMVDREGHIIALIDWEHCLSNLVHWELAIALHDLSIDEKQAFLEGYGLSWKRVKELAPALKAINIINYAPHIGNAAQTRDTAGLEAYRLRLSGALDLYSL